MRINSMGFITDEKIQPHCGTELTGNTLNSLITDFSRMPFLELFDETLISIRLIIMSCHFR